MRVVKSILVVALLAGYAGAESIQRESGWSGTILFGGGYGEYKNSEILGTRTMDFEVKRIDNLGSPSSESAIYPILLGVVRYTLDDKKTEIFVDNVTDDFPAMQTSAGLGIRHDFEDVGIVGLRLFKSSTPTKVWEDPFLLGQNRTSTDQTFGGIAIKWERVMGSNFEIEIQARKVELDTDNNAQSLVNAGLAGTSTGYNGSYYITQSEQQLLKRSGNMSSAKLLYIYPLNANNFLIPTLKLTSNNSDGNARDYINSEIGITHFYGSQRWSVGTSIQVSSSTYSKENPIFQKKQDTNYLSAGVDVTYKNIFGLDHWSLNGTAYVSSGNSNIDFYDSSLWATSLGVIYTF